MPIEWPTTYRDARGTENTVIFNDDMWLSFTVRGVTFKDTCWTNFEPVESTDPRVLKQFKTRELKDDPKSRNTYSELAGYSLSVEIPITVVLGKAETISTLSVGFEVGDQFPYGYIGPRMVLDISEQKFDVEEDQASTFEFALLNIQRQLPKESFFKCCFGCAFSSYNPLGDVEWGMSCFRNHKKEYLEADSVKTFVLDTVRAESVQETYFCNEFQPWDGQTGYRDPLIKPARVSKTST